MQKFSAYSTVCDLKCWPFSLAVPSLRYNPFCSPSSLIPMIPLLSFHPFPIWFELWFKFPSWSLQGLSCCLVCRPHCWSLTVPDLSVGYVALSAKVNEGFRGGAGFYSFLIFLSAGSAVALEVTRSRGDQRIFSSPSCVMSSLFPQLPIFHSAPSSLSAGLFSGEENKGENCVVPAELLR